jgi:hypothetical protein
MKSPAIHLQLQSVLPHEENEQSRCVIAAKLMESPGAYVPQRKSSFCRRQLK